MSWVGDEQQPTASTRPHLHLATEPPVLDRPTRDAVRVEADRRRDAETALAGLYRRVLDLEAGSISREAALRDLQRRFDEADLERREALAAVEVLAPQASELELLRRTKTFRWTRLPRRVWGFLLRHTTRRG